MLASLDRTEIGTAAALATCQAWQVMADEVARSGRPYELDDAELESMLVGLPEGACVSPEDLEALLAAEAPSLWFL
jgi:hypothetical protein